MDRQQDILDQVNQAIASGTPLRIKGGGTKDFYGYPTRGEPLDTAGHRGIIEYDPGELVITCRAGTRLAEIRRALAEKGQHLPFDPPAFGECATIGGAVSSGFSGPSRPWSGSLRDYLLGVKMVNGSGEIVRFGGQVMKNVAGYDISRLVAGAMGTLGVLLEVSFKVLPVPARELTLVFECDHSEAIREANLWSGQCSGQPLPLSAACWYKGRLLVRLSGAVSETTRAAAVMQAKEQSDDLSYWEALREHQTDFFTGPERLWRLSLPPAAGPLEVEADCMLDWGGAQRWYRSDLPVDEIRRQAAQAGGHATLFRGDSTEERFHPLPPALEQLHVRIKQALDPHGLFNPMRISRDW